MAMLDELRRFLPVRAALKLGPLLVFEVKLLDMDDDEPEDGDEYVANTSFPIGFALPEVVDEVNPRLDPWEDDDATSQARHPGR